MAITRNERLQWLARAYFKKASNTLGFYTEISKIVYLISKAHHYWWYQSYRMRMHSSYGSYPHLHYINKIEKNSDIQLNLLKMIIHGIPASLINDLEWQSL